MGPVKKEAERSLTNIWSRRGSVKILQRIGLSCPGPTFLGVSEIKPSSDATCTDGTTKLDSDLDLLPIWGAGAEWRRTSIIFKEL